MGKEPVLLKIHCIRNSYGVSHLKPASTAKFHVLKPPLAAIDGASHCNITKGDAVFIWCGNGYLRICVGNNLKALILPYVRIEPKTNKAVWNKPYQTVNRKGIISDICGNTRTYQRKQGGPGGSACNLATSINHVVIYHKGAVIMA